MKSHALTFVILVAFCSMQVLAYPAPSIDARSSSNGTGIYIVESGDTLDSIAANEGITPEQLEDANPGVSPTDLQVGETLILPDSASSNGTISNGTSSNETSNILTPRQTGYICSLFGSCEDLEAEAKTVTDLVERAAPTETPAAPTQTAGYDGELLGAAATSAGGAAPTSLEEFDWY